MIAYALDNMVVPIFGVPLVRIDQYVYDEGYVTA